MFDEKKTLERVLAKVAKTASRVQDSIPYRTVGGVYDDWSEKDISWWTNGFWPGLLWLTWRENHNPELAKWADGVEIRLDRAFQDFYGIHHDIGFMWHLSSVAQYRLSGNPDSRRRGLLAANLLAGRFNSIGRFFRAWNDDPRVDRRGWAIIDCLMNLPLLYWASAETTDPRFGQLAQAHTETAMKHFLRPDGSSKHILEFDPQTGAYLRNHAGQGAGTDSAWSRGAAWALYGFTLANCYTGRTDFLAAAERAAEFFLGHLPQDRVPFADFKAPEDGRNHKDSSAAAVAASGLLLLSQRVSSENRKRWADGGREILSSLTANYADDGEALLVHGCVAYLPDEPGWEDTTLIYGDYFYLEALLRLNGKPGLFD